MVADERVLRILAPAGSGKTRVLTRRIAYQDATGALDARHGLAITFTRKAASELRIRLKALGLRDSVAAGTFHSIAWAQLRDRWQERGMSAPTLLDSRIRLVGDVVRAADTRLTTPLVATEIDWAKARMITPDTYAVAAADAGRRVGNAAAHVARLFANYEDERRNRRMVDFDDLLAQCARELEIDPAWAEAQHWRYRHIFVDEFQDVNPLQFRLLKAWLGPEATLCVVGDANQAIYAWNGADASFLGDFAGHFPGAATIGLERNYRSTAAILDLAAALVAPPPQPPAPVGGNEDAASTDASQGTLIDLTASPPTIDGRAPTQEDLTGPPDDGPVPTITAYGDGDAEARGVVAAIIRRRGPGRSLSHHGVLARTNSQLEVVASALADAGVPHRVRGRTDATSDPEVAALLAEHRTDRGPLSAFVTDLLASDADASATVAGVETGATTAARAMTELADLATEQLDLNPAMTTADFVAWLSSDNRANTGRTAPDGRAFGEAVELSTFHAAKGLEWPVVHLVGLEEGYVPISHAATPEARGEEQRLLYVAVTRARSELHCSWAQTRAFGERLSGRQPSPWLAVLSRRIDELTNLRSPVQPGHHLATSRRLLAEARGGDSAADPVRRALSEWRSRAAKAALVSPRAVLADEVLDAIVARRPTTMAELADIDGFSPIRRQRTGAELLALIANADEAPAT